MLLPLLTYLLPTILLITLTRNYTLLPSSIPGPFLARFSNLYRFFSVLFSSPHDDQTALHKKHGPVVRLGPDMVSLQGASFVPQIYGIGKGLIKSQYYGVFQNIVNGKRTASLVAMTDESDHARTKRVVAHAYSLSTLVEYEPLVDSTIRIFLDQLSKSYAQTGQPCDFGQQLQYFAFDVIGELTFSKRLGFIEQNEDVGGIISAIGANFRYFSVIGQMPWLDEVLGKNPLYVRFFRKPVSSPILVFAQKLLQERLDTLENDEKPTTSSTTTTNKPDFLSRFLQSRQTAGTGEDADLTTDAKLLSYLFMNINAGSDTIASTLKTLFHALLAHPTTLTTLVDEITSAATSGNLTLPIPTYAQTQQLPYLSAVVKETFRLGPALSLPLERVVPPEGLTLTVPTSTTTSSSSSSSTSSLHLPAGTIVGINPYVQHRHPQIFGADANHWRPERWLDCEAERSKEMERQLLTFGAGKRGCLGRNVAVLEVYKVVVAVLGRFVIGGEGEGWERGWRVRNVWVLDQRGLRVRLRERKEGG